MITLRLTRNLVASVLLAIFCLAFAPMATAQGDGKEHHETHQNSDGTWTQTDTNKDGSKTETQMDKDLHKTKETEYDDKGNVVTENDWKWNGQTKKDVKRKEHHHAHGNVVESETEFDEYGNKTLETVWFDGYTIIDTYRDGKRVRRDKIVKGKVVKTQLFDKDGNLITGNIAAPPSSPVLSLGTTLNGVVIGAPDQFVSGEAMAFRVITLTGEVVSNEPTRLSNSEGQSVWVQTDKDGVVAANIPNGWGTLVVEVLGASVTSHASTEHRAVNGLMIANPPRFIQPGNLTVFHGSGFTPTLGGNSVSISDQVGIIMGASPRAVTLFVPASVKLGPTQIQVTSGIAAAPPISCTAVNLTFDPGPSILRPGQRVTRTLRVLGTEERLPIQVLDPPNDAARVDHPGLRFSSGGKNNIVKVRLTGLRQGSYSLVGSFDWNAAPRLAANLTDYEKDLANAEAARKDQAGRKESADSESDDSVAAAKRIAAAQAGMAAEDWDAAAEARKVGDDKKAAALEKAAKAREEAAKAYGADRNPARGAAAAKDAKASEDAAKAGG